MRRVARLRTAGPTGAPPRSCSPRPEACVCRPGSSSSSPSPSAASRSASLPTAQAWRNSREGYCYYLYLFYLFYSIGFTCFDVVAWPGPPSPPAPPPHAHHLLHVASKMEAGQGFLLLGVVVRLLLGLLFLFASPLILERWSERHRE